MATGRLAFHFHGDVHNRRWNWLKNVLKKSRQSEFHANCEIGGRMFVPKSYFHHDNV